MSMESREWHHSANELMKAAVGVQAQAIKQSEQSKKSHQDTYQENLAMYQDLHGNLEQKVKTSHRLIDKLEARAKSVKENIEATKTSLTQLEMALHAKNAPLKLCAWRMEQRQKRPLREHVRDQVEMALQDEKTALADTQKKLTEAIVMTKSMLSVLQEKFEDLTADIDSKMQALSVDELCLRTTMRTYSQSESRTPTSRTSTGARKTGTVTAQEESNRNEMRRQQDTRNHDTAARRREEASVEMRTENQLLVQRCSKTAKDARERTEKRLQERVNEVRLMRKRLENELRETLRKADNTRVTISETASQIQAIQEPIALCSTHTSWRKQRDHREQIVDGVETRLTHQKQNLMRATEELRGHRQNEKNILTTLGEQVERLKEDLKDKTAALEIDVSCLERVDDSWISKSSRSAQVTPLSARTGTGKFSRGGTGTKFGMADPYVLPHLTAR